MIELRGVTVELGGKPVVDGVTAAVRTGSGSGSSVRTAPARRRCCGRSPGSFRSRARSLGGRSVEASARRAARLVAVVPQEPSTPPWMTVAEYVLLGRTPHLGPLAREGTRDREAAARSLARLDLLPFADRRLGTLSGGEKQRVVVARARPGGADRSARRTDRRARYRSSAAGSRPARRTPRGVRAHARRRDARLDARRAVRRSHASARPAALLRMALARRAHGCLIAQHYGADRRRAVGDGCSSSHGGRLDLPERRLAA